MRDTLHLTPQGRGSRLTRAERRAAWALVDESIRHELAERHARHWPRHRPSARRIFAARVAARRRRLVVITDSDLPSRRVLIGATYRSSSARLGRIAAVPLTVARLCTKGVVLVATMLVVLIATHGRVGIGTLFAAGIIVALFTAPMFSSLKLRLSDRVLAARVHLLAPEVEQQLTMLAVLHQLGYPRSAVGSAAATRDLELVGAALTSEKRWCWVTRPCCAELAELYSASAGAMWLPAYARIERTVLAFVTAQPEPEEQYGEASITDLGAFRARSAVLEPV